MSPANQSSRRRADHRRRHRRTESRAGRARRPATHRDGGADQRRPRRGDLKENAEYHVAKEDQAHMETRIKRLQRTAPTTRSWSRPTTAAADTFAFGRTAEVLDESKGETVIWTLVGSTEANLAEGRLSAESPIGQALMNTQVGATVEVETPRGTESFKVLKLVVACQCPRDAGRCCRSASVADPPGATTSRRCCASSTGCGGSSPIPTTVRRRRRDRVRRRRRAGRRRPAGRGDRRAGDPGRRLRAHAGRRGRAAATTTCTGEARRSTASPGSR